MPTQRTKKPSIYAVFIRLWFFLVVSLVIISILFPVRIPLCGTGGDAEGSELTGRQFALLMAGNGVIAAALMRIRKLLLYLVLTAPAVVLVSWGLSWAFSIPLRTFGN